VLQPQGPDFGNDVGIERSVSQADVAEFCADGRRANLNLDRMLTRRRRTTAGAAGVAGEVVFWVTAVGVIDVSNLYLCGGERNVRPACIGGPCQSGGHRFDGSRDQYYALLRSSD
jgi:hypothetical protein